MEHAARVTAAIPLTHKLTASQQSNRHRLSTASLPNANSSTRHFHCKKKDGGIDSIKYFNETLTFYCNVPNGFLASKQNADQLPATAINDLKMLEQTALREIIATDTKVKFHYREQGEDGAIHNVTLSSQAIKKLYKTMKEPVKE